MPNNPPNAQFFITQACDVGNKGDQGIIKSEVAFLRKLFPNSEISVATWWSNDLLQKVEPSVNVYSPLVDFKIKGKDAPLPFYPFIMIITSWFSIFSALLIKSGLPAIYRVPYIKSLKGANLVLSSGHQPFVEGSRYSKRTLWNLLANYLVLYWGALDIFIAKKIFNRRFANFPQSVGPFETFFGKKLAKFIFSNMDFICVRENISKSTLKELEVNTPVYSMIDTAFFFEPRLTTQEKVKKPVIGVSPCFVAGMTAIEQEQYISVFSELLLKIREDWKVNIIFLPSQTTKGKAMALTGRQDDYVTCQFIQKHMSKLNPNLPTEIVNIENVDDYVSILSNLDLLIATRMHPTIFAASQGVPFVEVIYEHKQVGLLKNLQVENLGLSFSGLSVEGLYAKTAFVWQNKTQLGNNIAARVTTLRSCNIPILERLIKVAADYT
jgi:polysaccharide pyruvyl transferase WcaK-like protein